MCPAVQVRAARRLREARPKAIDHIARHLFLLTDFGGDMSEPCSVFEGLQVEELRELYDDIR